MNKIALTVLLTNVLFVNENAVAQNAEESLSGTDNWIISETTSPVDYSPLVAATTRSRDSIESSAMQLSIYCRNGLTYVVLAGQAISGRGENYAISYSVNGDKPVRAGVSSSSFGSGAALKGDVVSFLQSLPDQGEIVIRSATQAGSAWEGNFSLRGLKVVRSKIAAACKWPRVNTEPRH
jgi:hypothetical protein